MLEEQVGSYAMRLMVDGVTTVVKSSSRVMMDIVAKYAAEREKMSEAEKMQQYYKKNPCEAFLKDGKEPGAITLNKEDARKLLDPLSKAGIPIYVVSDDISNNKLLVFDKKLSSVIQEYCKRLGLIEYSLEQSSTKRFEQYEHKLHTNMEKVQNPEDSKAEIEREDKVEQKNSDVIKSNKTLEHSNSNEDKEANFPEALKEQKLTKDLSEPNLIAYQEIVNPDSLEEKENLTVQEASKTDFINSQDGLPDPMKQAISLNQENSKKQNKSFKQSFAKYEQEAKVREESRRQARTIAKGLENRER